MTAEFRVLGPVEASVDGRPLRLPPQPRAVLAMLLLDAGRIVSSARLIDALWGSEPPSTASNIVQGYVSHLRKALGREAIETREPGYVVHVQPEALDLHRFERLATEGARALEAGAADRAAERLREALDVWSGAALEDVSEGDVLRPAAARLDELRLVALERRVEADLLEGRHQDAAAELDALTAEHPLRERLRWLHMLALYRCDRQADALETYRRTRSLLVDELGLEPGQALQELEQAILRHDPALAVAARPSSAEAPLRRTVLVAALDLAELPALVAIATPLVRSGDRELVVSTTARDAEGLRDASARVRTERTRLADDGIPVRAAAFTSLVPGADLARLAREQDADLLVVDAPDGLLEDGRLVGLLDEAPCDVAVLVAGAAGPGPVLVPFTGAEHDWAAVELGAWLARARGLALVLLGTTTGQTNRDASRLLASASLAVQRALGVDAEPLLVEPSPETVVDAARDAGIVAVGLTDRWRREGLGRTRTALAASPHHATLLVRRGLRPGGLAPRAAETRFTWTIAG